MWEGSGFGTLGYATYTFYDNKCIFSFQKTLSAILIHHFCFSSVFSLLSLRPEDSRSRKWSDL